MSVCENHKCETAFKVGDHNKSIEYCPECESESRERLMLLVPGGQIVEAGGRNPDYSPEAEIKMCRRLLANYEKLLSAAEVKLAKESELTRHHLNKRLTAEAMIVAVRALAEGAVKSKFASDLANDILDVLNNEEIRALDLELIRRGHDPDQVVADMTEIVDNHEIRALKAELIAANALLGTVRWAAKIEPAKPGEVRNETALEARAFHRIEAALDTATIAPGTVCGGGDWVEEIKDCGCLPSDLCACEPTYNCDCPQCSGTDDPLLPEEPSDE
jgi:hypothetical protein